MTKTIQQTKQTYQMLRQLNVKNLFTYSPIHLFTLRKTAFTLAEVLITLAIIGVVAVLTVPTLIANNQEKGWYTAAMVFELKLYQALQVMNTQGTLAGYRTTRAFVDELSNHLKITKVCDSDKLTECFSDKVYWDVLDISKNGTVSDEVDITNVKTASDLGQDDWGTEVLGFQLNNGTNGLIAYNPTSTCRQDQFSNQITGTACVAVLYDTSGFSKPNTNGKDMRAINAELSGNCAFKSGSTCFVGTPFTPTPLTKAECEAEKANLGINECGVQADYWAGAVKACGGVNKMPTMAQLAEIGNYIYNTDKVQAKNNVEDLTMEKVKALYLGFDINSNKRFWVWSGEEYSVKHAYYRNFNPTNTYYTYGDAHDGSRDCSYIMAVCIQ